MPSTPRWFRWLLRLYPRTYRERFGAEMEAFHRHERASGQGGLWYVVRLVADHARAAAVVRWGDGDGVVRVLARDLWLGVRRVRRAPAFALFATLTLALGIGATTAVFSVLDRVVLRPMPYPGSERMALVGIGVRNRESAGPLSPALMAALQDAPGPAEAIVGGASAVGTLTGAGDPERLITARVTRGFFEFFGARAAVGRLLGDADHAPGAPRATVIGYGFWQERFGGDPGAVGRTLTLDGDTYTIVGVLDPGFVPPPSVSASRAIWVSMGLQQAPPERGTFYIAGAARLRPGESLQSMRDYVARVVDDVYPPGDAPGFLSGGVVRDYRTHVVGDLGGTLVRVLIAVSLLLLIACVNVTSLLLTRGAERAHELGVRTALGASRLRLLGELLTESLVLALAGCGAGSLLAWAAVRQFRLHAPEGLPRLAEVAVDGRALAFALALALATVLVFGLLPAFRGTARAGSRQRGATAGRRDRRLRSLLVAGETALAVVLAVASALLAHDLARMATRDPGFAPEGMATMQLNLRPRYEADEWAPMWSRVLERASALRGATAATIATEAPFAGNRLVSTYRPEDTEAGDPAGVFLNTVAVMGDYVGALGGRVVEGRALAPRDDDGPPVALVNEAFVRRFWPGESAVGKHVRSGGAGVDDEPDFEVVGVIADMITDPGRPVPERIYVPSRYEPQPEMEVMVRTEEDPVATAAALRNVARTLDPTLPAAVRTVTSLGWEALARPRFYAGLFGGFAVVALLLTLVGVYGTTAYNTRARAREIGIRLALGADVTQVVGRVVSRAGTAVVGGTVIGLLAAALGGRIMEGFLHDVGPGDLPSYAVVGILVLAGGLVAAWLPARRAGRVDPVETLRREG